MSNITLSNLSYHGSIYAIYRRRYEIAPRKHAIIFEDLENFTGSFQFGKSYLLNAPAGKGAWALGWIVAGELEAQQGMLLRDDQPFPRQERRKISWLVRYDQVKRFGFLEQSVQAQVQHGLKNGKNGSRELHTEAQYIEEFNLAPSRYIRRLRQLSSEAWRASPAIGLANGKRIFVFPDIGYLRPRFVEEYRQWLEKTIRLLTNSGALVLFLIVFTPAAEGLCDAVVDLQP